MDTAHYPLPVIGCAIATLEPVFTGVERRLSPAGRAEPLCTAESDQVCRPVTEEERQTWPNYTENSALPVRPGSAHCYSGRKMEYGFNCVSCI